VGMLEVTSAHFQDSTPRFCDAPDPYEIRFRVQALSWLELTKAIPIRDDVVFDSLSFTRGRNKATSSWTGPFRGSLAPIAPDDAEYLARLILEQETGNRTYPLTDEDVRRARVQRVHREDKTVTVSVPDDAEPANELAVPDTEVRESLRIQAVVASIGARMGMQIWVPRSDRAAVLGEHKALVDALVDHLPFDYGDVTMGTIEQIDVLWLHRRTIVRAFEVEHTTSIYSGILRMADLLALQPNIDIKLHIVAPEARKDQVMRQIKRPVFSLLEKGPLSESCSFVSYGRLRELSQHKLLAHMSPSVLDEYAEEAE